VNNTRSAFALLLRDEFRLRYNPGPEWRFKKSVSLGARLTAFSVDPGRGFPAADVKPWVEPAATLLMKEGICRKIPALHELRNPIRTFPQH
jgi:hypothetical protein